MPAGAHCTVNAFIIDAEFSPRCGCCCLRACLMLFRFLADSCFATPRKILINSKALHNAPLIKLRNPASASTRGCFYHDRHDSTDRRNFCSTLLGPFNDRSVAIVIRRLRQGGFSRVCAMRTKARGELFLLAREE